VTALDVDLDGGQRWWTEAACIGRTGLFFATDEFSQRVAVTICRRCPVRAPCLVDVLATEGPGERFGVVGGLTVAQRQAWATASADGSA
jgi:WhiB family redox-sensing transcriptional regulator